MVKKLPLQTGEYALVDDEDYERCKDYTWWIHYGYTTSTVQTKINGKHVYLSRFITECSKNYEAVQIGDTLEYTKDKLSVVEKGQAVLRKKSQRGSSSKYKGVCRHNKSNKWAASISRDGKKKHLGVFESEEIAAVVYNKAAIEVHGEHAFLNDIGNENTTKPIVKKGKTKELRTRRDSKIRGVRQDENFVVRFKSERIGKFETIKEAKQAYDQTAWDSWQEQAVLHYPENIPAYKEGTYRKETTWNESQ